LCLFGYLIEKTSGVTEVQSVAEFHNNVILFPILEIENVTVLLLCGI